MYFKKVEISQFRNLVSTSFIPSRSLNIIYGSNGSGKSSLLEALYYIATGNSFRSSKLSTVIQHDTDCLTLFSEVFSTVTHRVGIKRCRDLNNQTRVNSKDIQKRSELVQLLPLQIISPESISLLLEGSDVRRSFIDWSLFHVEHSFYYHISHYLRSLKQRNALLKSNDLSQIEYWNSQLSEYGEVIDSFRKQYVESILPVIAGLLHSLLPEVEIEVSYRSGWSKDIPLEEALIRSQESDIKLKHTTVGPHRGDLIVKSGGVKVTDILSRGQLKLVVVAMKLAQILLLQSSTEKNPIILLDDIASELDIEHRALLLNTVKELSSQVFVTTPDLDLIDYSNWDENKVFHVEHGQIKEVV
ncbi:MAG: DNA replication/repair protein RecF [Pseudomonadota bacterium]